MIRTGLDCLRSRNFDRLRGRRYGIVCNQATVASDFRHILELLPSAGLAAIFGPQHGLYGHTQDNMIEWEGDAGLPIPIHSLYGAVRKPTPEMLDGLDLLVIDLPDIGSRYYTFAWTACLCAEACDELGIDVLILDRPNPIGRAIEGPINELRSFVGLHPVPIRHGLTLGELVRKFHPIVQAEDYEGEGETVWAMPSPNMPTLDTAFVYPGACLLEGTTLSEGRGTTRPFEIFGAPHLNRDRLASELNDLDLPGVYFRPLQFQPTFQKFSGELCEGCFVHVTNRSAFQPVRTYAHVLDACYRARPEGFWKQPPYEYEEVHLPIDILWGTSKLREGIEAGRITDVAMS